MRIITCWRRRGQHQQPGRSEMASVGKAHNGQHHDSEAHQKELCAAFFHEKCAAAPLLRALALPYHAAAAVYYYYILVYYY